MTKEEKDIIKCFICEQDYNRHNLIDVRGFLFCNECFNDVQMELIESNE